MEGNNALDQREMDTREGDITSELEVLSLGMDDEAIRKAIGNRVSTAESFWNAQLDLKNEQKLAESFWTGSYNDEVDLYGYQEDYYNSHIFTAVETLVSLVTSNPAKPLVTPAYNTEASYELSQQHQKTLLSKYEDLYLKREFQMVARHLLIGYRFGAMKYWWDDSMGQLQDDGSRFGDLRVKAIRPQRLVIDAAAQDINDIPLIAEYKSILLDELCEKYPDKKDDILRESGISQGTKIDLTKREGYLEVHFTTDDKGKDIEAIAWKYKSVVLDSTKSPFWNYDDDTQNFLPKPQKPYVLFNFLNLGRWVIDDTSLTKQAMSLQRIHDKRGRQLVENADQANGGWVFNTLMVDEADAAAWINDPGDKILAKGNVNEAVGRLPVPLLPNYVMEDKVDARNEIDNIFGTHGAIKGETSGSKTLGQDVLSQRGDTARLNTLTTAMEDGADRLYKGITQAMKVLYTEPQLVRYDSEDDKPQFFTTGSGQIETGMAIRVKSGSVLPEDPLAKRDETLKLLPILDPLNMAKGLNKENPKEWAKQQILFRMMPDRYMTEILGYTPDAESTQDPLALRHIALLNHGGEIPVVQNPTKAYLSTYQAFIESPEFGQLPVEIQTKHKQHLEQILGSLKQAMGLPEQQPAMPTPQPTNTPPADGGTPPMGAMPIDQPQQMNGLAPSQNAILPS